MTDKRVLQITYDIYIRAYEVDAMGIVSNIVYVKWFEDMRHIFLDQFYTYKEMMAIGHSPILTKTEVEYKAPLTIFDHPTGYAWMEELGSSKWVMAFEIRSESIVHCTGHQSGCFYDINRKRPIVWPKYVVELYETEVKKQNEPSINL